MVLRVIIIVCLNFIFFFDVCKSDDCSSSYNQVINSLISSGKSVNFFSFNDTNESAFLTWTKDGGILLATTHKLYQSTNRGISFTEITSRLLAPVDIDHEFGFQTIGNNTYLFSKISKVLYVTSDSGNTWNNVSLGVPLAPRLFGLSGLDQVFFAINNKTHDLYKSLDGGLKWKNLTISVEDFHWVRGGKNGSIFILRRTGNDDDAYTLSKSTDLGETWSMLLPNVRSVAARSQFLYVTVSSNSSTRQLRVSKNGGATFANVSLPPLPLENYYSILEIENDIVFLHVDEKKELGYGTLYKSDNEGIQFTSSLVLQLDTKNGSVSDFYRVSSMNTTFLTTQMDQSSTMHSMITFNNGANWSLINKPVNADCDNSKSDHSCSLQVVNRYSQMANVSGQLPLSSPSAPGLLLVNGHVGDKMKTHPPNVFVSIDGGFTWNKRLDGPHLYTMANNGSVLLALGHPDPKSGIRLSVDRGLCWHTLNLSNAAQVNRVDLLISEPGRGRSVAFVARGTKDNMARVYTVDLDQVIPPIPCIRSDYEEWTPHGGVPCPSGQTTLNGCVNGVRNKVLRVKAGAMCVPKLEKLNDRPTPDGSQLLPSSGHLLKSIESNSNKPSTITVAVNRSTPLSPTIPNKTSPSPNLSTMSPSPNSSTSNHAGSLSTRSHGLAIGLTVFTLLLVAGLVTAAWICCWHRYKQRKWRATTFKYSLLNAYLSEVGTEEDAEGELGPRAPAGNGVLVPRSNHGDHAQPNSDDMDVPPLDLHRMRSAGAGQASANAGRLKLCPPPSPLQLLRGTRFGQEGHHQLQDSDSDVDLLDN